MTPQWLMLARLDGLLARLNEAHRAISTEGQDSRIKERIGNELARRLLEHTRALEGRRSKVAENGEVSKYAWAEVKSSVTASLLDECLLYLQAARSRSSGVEADLCEIIDALFDELAGKTQSLAWKSYSVFAPEDSFDVLSRIIRVRYPVSGVWDIPIAVHEFGHFLSGNLRRVRPDGSAQLVFEEEKNSFVPPQSIDQTPLGMQQSHTDWRFWLDEIFADVFATYAVGPSFACSCLLVRFDPGSTEEETDGKHPSYAKRAYVILQTLRFLNEEQLGRGQFGQAIQVLDTSWQGACEAAGTRWNVPDETWLGRLVSNIYNMLKTVEGGLRFNDWKAASNKLRLLEQPNDAVGDFTLVELLNAAWICRLKKEGSNPEQLSENFVQLARRKTSS
jgi:hypothetical protein